MLFLHILGFFITYLVVCDNADGPKILGFYKSDVIIRFFVQLNLLIQYLKHLSAFTAILCCFDKFWGYFTTLFRDQ